MDKLLRFSDYDIFGCLSTGLAALVLCDLLVGTHLVLGAQWSVADGVVVTCTSYIVGQILAAPAAWLLERQITYKLLGRPISLLLQARPALGVRAVLSKSLLDEYFTPLPPPIRRQIRTTAGAHAHDSEALFHAAMAGTKELTLVRAKMETFLRLYGFCRNVAFASLAGAVALIIKWGIELLSVGWAAALPTLALAGAALLIGVGLFHRYLKFLRLHTLTLLSNYAGTTPAAISEHAVHDAN